MSALDFTGIQADEWIDVLADYQKNTISALRGQGKSLEEVATVWLSRTGPETNYPFGAGTPQDNLVAAVEVEMRKLICGDPSYDDLRKRVALEWSKSKTAIVAMVAAVVSSAVGIAAGVLVPIVAIFLAIATEVGSKAWCNASKTP